MSTKTIPINQTSALSKRIIRDSMSRIVPERFLIEQFADFLFSALFPVQNLKSPLSDKDILTRLNKSKEYLTNLLEKLDFNSLKQSPSATADEFFRFIPDIYDLLVLDSKAHFDNDPAANSIDEIVSTYPGFRAIAYFRIAHQLLVLNVKLLPRIITEYAHNLTGIDIHPGAIIGESFVIDHGTGIVIGETSEIGNNIVLYQGVTLGAFSVARKNFNQKRHPTLRENIKVYANATILGGDTVIESNVIIGANSWVTKSVEANSKVKSNCH